MKQYKLVDNIFGWVAFLIAAFVYCSTIEPTASFWDCPEFITTAYKQEIGHPPGAPFFMLLGNFFTHFASDTTQVAKMVNTMSALLSAVCIMFLFWTITHLARKLIISDWKEMTTAKMVGIEASGMVGALIYTFSDTFWFSAVEGEVYAFSSAFTAVVFWLILKWEDHADEPHSDRWLVLIAYMTGLSIGVHLLNLLCIPAGAAGAGPGPGHGGPAGPSGGRGDAPGRPGPVPPGAAADHLRPPGRGGTGGLAAAGVRPARSPGGRPRPGGPPAPARNRTGGC